MEASVASIEPDAGGEIRVGVDDGRVLTADEAVAGIGIEFEEKTQAATRRSCATLATRSCASGSRSKPQDALRTIYAEG